MFKKIFVAAVMVAFLIPAFNVLASEVSGEICTGIGCPVDRIVMESVVASPVAGSYSAGQTVTLTATGSSAICFDTSGANPVCAYSGTSCTTGTKYSSALTINDTTTVKARSCYANGNSTAISSFTYTISPSAPPPPGGGGGGGSVVTVPSLSSISIAPDTTSVIITWKTNIVATSRAEYGLTSNLGQYVTSSNYVTNHSLTITGLTAATTYTYIIKSVSSDGGMGYTTNKTFTTLAEKKLVTGTAAITSSGGTIIGTAETGAFAKVTIGSGAVTADTTFTVTPLGTAAAGTGNPPTGSFMIGNYVYNFTATSGGTAVTSFVNPVTLTFVYTDSQVTGLDEASLKIYYWSGTAWVALTTTVDSISNTLTVQVTHFTSFAIFGQKKTVTVSNQTLIAQLQAQLAQLQALLLQLLAAQGGTSNIVGIPASFTFTKTLSFGMKSTDVKYLQIVLNSDSSTKVALTGVGSSGNETTVFGNATKAAVLKFQLKYKIAGGTGSVGPVTRAQLNKLLGK